MKQIALMIIISLVIFISVILLALNLQKKNEQEMILMFQKHQMDISLQASERIGSHFQEQTNDIKILSSLIALNNLHPKEINTLLKGSLDELRDKHIKTISIYDENGSIKYSTNSKLLGLNFAHTDYSRWAAAQKENDEVFISFIRQGFSEVVMAYPFYSKGKNSYAGMISFVINIGELFNEQLLPLIGGGRDAWIMDKNGILLYNPAHSEMVAKNINNIDKSCYNCHLSFDCYKPLFVKDKGSLDYQPKKGERKLASYSTVKFMNITWVVVINISYNPVDNFISSNFRQTWLIILMIGGLISAASFLVYRFNLSKLIAETEARDLREKNELKKKIELSEEKYRKLTDRVTDLLYAFDNDLRYTYWNKAFEKLTGIPAKDALGKTFYDLFPGNRDSVMEKTFKQVLSAKISQRFIDEITIDGKSFHFEIACYPSEDGISVFSRDVTEHIKNDELRKKAEEQLRAYAEELKMTNDTKNKLFSIIAHDLRGPFYPIISLAEVLQNDIETFSIEEIKEFAGGIYDSSREVFSVVENLLEWSMMQRNCIQFNPEKIYIRKELEDVISVSRYRAGKKNIQLINDVSEYLMTNADKRMLHSILQNLISNSIKFTEPGGKIQVRAVLENNNIKISIVDNGIGISDDKLSKMFQIDKNITSRGTNQENGTGLGLHLCKEFVEKHGGIIWAESTVGAGTEFHFTLNCAEVNHEEELSCVS